MKKTALLLLLVVAGMLGLWHFGRPAYRNYREQQSAQRARAFLSSGAYTNASLSARQALLLNSNNLAACRVMAELAALSHAPAELDWRRRVAELAPTIENRLLFVATCLRVEAPPYSLAVQRLAELAATAQNSAAYHELAAQLALKLGRRDEAALEFAAATRLQPTNQFNQLNLAVLRLASPDKNVAATALTTLQNLSSDPALGVVALRWQVAECLRRGDLAGAALNSDRLLTNPGADQFDQLEQLHIRLQSHRPDFRSYLAVLQQRCATNANMTYNLARWMIAHGLPDDASDWLAGCPAKLRAEQPVPLALAECYLARQDWPGLEAYLAGQTWPDLEHLRFAFLSRSAEQQHQEFAADSRWRSALREAENRLGALISLLELSRNWSNPRHATEVLWRIGNRFPGERWVWRDLEHGLYTAGNTSGLLKLYRNRASFDPTNFVVQNNLAATSLLLKDDLPGAYRLARELYLAHPDEGIIASTYAWSLHLQGRSREGLAIFQKVPAKQLSNPSISFYYGLLAAANGDVANALHYLGLADGSPLLPEEKSLLTAARGSLPGR